jgi:hypothetical protein
VNGTLSVAGTIDIAAGGNVEVQSGGTFTTADGASGDLKGAITVKAGGTSKDLKSGGGTLWKDAYSTGEYVFEAGAKGYVGGENAGDLMIGSSSDPTNSTWIQLASGTFSNSQTDYILDGEATMRTTFWINADQTVTIKTGGKLTYEPAWVPEDRHGYLVVVPGGSIVGEGSAAIEVKTALNSVTGNNIYFLGDSGDGSGTNANFYDNTETKLSTSDPDGVSGATMVPVGVYDWDASLDGGNGGWKAQP